MGLGRDGEPGITAVLVIDAFGAECVTEALPYDATDAEGADGPDGERVSGEAACEQQHLDNKIHEMM